jgi:hypothetical protein
MGIPWRKNLFLQLKRPAKRANNARFVPKISGPKAGKRAFGRVLNVEFCPTQQVY